MSGDAPQPADGARARRPSRRRRGAPTAITISWRSIPAQVNVQTTEGVAQALLTSRFQHAIDRAAAVADMTDTQSYVEQWQRTSVPLSAAQSAQSAQEVADAVAATIEATFDRARLEALVAAGGAEPESEPEPEPERNDATPAQANHDHA